MNLQRLLFWSIGALVIVLPQWTNGAISSKHLKHIDEENWRQIMQGEWMIEFHAPWCPACKDLHKAWNAFADWGKDLNINVGEIEVTENPGLSGRFLITSLPTIFHIKDGVFRIYGGPRDTEDFIWFVEEQKWKVVEQLPSWKYPDSVQMAIVAKFFKLSMSVRDMHSQLIEEHGIPPWASFAIFAGGTLFLGSILGVVIVYLIDFVFPNKPSAAPPVQTTQSQQPNGERKKNKKEEQKKKKAATKGDEKPKEKKSDDEERHHSQSESQNSQSEAEEEEKEDKRKHEKNDKKVANGKSPSTSQKKNK